MSAEIRVAGILSQILERVDLIIGVVNARKATGFPIKQPGHKWLHRTRANADVCPYCRPLHFKVINGPDVDRNYPAHRLHSSLVVADAEYHSRADVPIDAPCYCKLQWINPSRDLTADLSEDIRRAAG